MASTLFPTNMHKLERTARVLIGAGFVVTAALGMTTPWGWLGAIPMITGLSGTCPLYTLFGFSTCGTAKA